MYRARHAFCREKTAARVHWPYRIVRMSVPVTTSTSWTMLSTIDLTKTARPHILSAGMDTYRRATLGNHLRTSPNHSSRHTTSARAFERIRRCGRKLELSDITRDRNGPTSTLSTPLVSRTTRRRRSRTFSTARGALRRKIFKNSDTLKSLRTQRSVRLPNAPQPRRSQRCPRMAYLQA